MASELHIGKLNLRVPASDRDAGQRLAVDIAGKLAEAVPSDLNGRLGALNVRVRIPEGADEAEMGDTIVAAVANALGKVTRK